MKTSRLNKPVFFFSVVIYTILFLIILIFHQRAAMIINGILNFTLHNLGWMYILGYIIVFFVCIYLSFGKFGNKRLGGKDSKPEYSFFAWIGMLFCTGLGVGLVFYGVSEPVAHYITSPIAINETAEAAAEAMRITFFHWTLLPWAIYSIVGLAVGYYAYEKNLPPLISTALYSFWGEKGVRGLPGKIVDAFSLIALVCGISMSLGFAATQSMTGIGMEFQFDITLKNTAAAVVIIGLIALFSALSGLQKGLKFISEFNTYLVIAMLVFALFAGPTTSIIRMLLESCGNFLIDFPRALFAVDGFGIIANKVGFEWTESWTVFYWAWWVAFAPFVGTFLAKISKGRTVREFIFACILMPSLLCICWFTCYGGTALHLDMTSYPGLAQAINGSMEGSLFILLDALPLPQITIIAAIILIITLIITSMDSATFMAAVFSSKNDKNISFSLRVFWAIYIMITAILMIYLGGLELLKYTAVILAFPFMIIIIIMALGLIKESKTKHY